MKTPQTNGVDLPPEEEALRSASVDPAHPDYPFQAQEHRFIWRVHDDRMESTDPRVWDVMGCRAEDFSWRAWMDLIHPADAALMPLMKEAVLRFFNDAISLKNPERYQASFLFRTRAGAGSWKHILHRSHPIQRHEDGAVSRLSVTHTAVGFLGVLPFQRVSFIGGRKDAPFYTLVPDIDKLLHASSAIDLTIREMDVFRAMMDGLNSRQIAEKLYITKNTVDTHRRKLLRKTGAKNMTELAMRLARYGTL